MLQCKNNTLNIQNIVANLYQRILSDYIQQTTRERLFNAILMNLARKKIQILHVPSLFIFLFTCKEARTFLTPFSLFGPVTAADVVKSGATLASQVVHYPR